MAKTIAEIYTPTERAEILSGLKTTMVDFTGSAPDPEIANIMTRPVARCGMSLPSDGRWTAAILRAGHRVVITDSKGDFIEQFYKEGDQKHG